MTEVSHPITILFSPNLNLQLDFLRPLLLQTLLNHLDLGVEFLQALVVLLLW